MSAVGRGEGFAAARPARAQRSSRAVAPLALVALVLLTATFARLWLPVDPDTSWLIAAAGRVLDGAVPYRDIVEANPPASIFLYVPAVMLARLTGLPAEAVTDALVMAAMAASLALTLGMAVRGGVIGAARLGLLVPAGLAILTILPLYSFAQRDHIVVAALLPGLACIVLRAQGRRPGCLTGMLAGLGAGVAVAVKPVFALALVLPVLDAMRSSSWRFVFRLPELWLGAALSLAYVGAVGLLVPAFTTQVLPLLSVVYLPARTPLVVLMLLPPFWIWLGLLAGFSSIGGWRDPLGRVLALASCGFSLGFLIQGKGFGYQELPAVLSAGLACATALSAAWLSGDRRTTTLLRLAPAFVATLVAVQHFAQHFDVARFAPGLTAAIGAIAPAPSLLTIGGDMPMGNALARQVGGTWVGSAPTAWVTYFARWITPDADTDPRFAPLIRAEQARYAGDILRAHPAVLLIENDGWLAWAHESTELAAALAGYDEVGRFGPVRLLRPRATLPAPVP